MALAGLYRRILPSPPAIDFASTEGKKLFTEAIHDGSMEGFFKLISYFQTQSEPAFCGLASLSMVLNALAIDPGRKWKGPWRWFDENMLDCCEPLEKIKNKGVTFGKVICLAHCAGARVEAFRANQSSIDDFRKYVMTCSSSDDRHLIASYHRGTFSQTGTGHFSPIGGYHAKSDMALILDVARFKYPPHWVPLTLLWEAMNTVDESTGHHRGFMLVSKNQRAPALLYTLSCKDESWMKTAKYLIDDVPVLLRSRSLKDVNDVLSTFFTSLPSDFTEFIKWVVELRRRENGPQLLSEEEKDRVAIKEAVLKQVQETRLFDHVTNILHSDDRIPTSKQMSDSSPSSSITPVEACCRVSGILSGRPSDRFCCRGGTCVRCYRATAARVASGGAADEMDVLVPVSESECGACCHPETRRPHGDDLLTALLLALPPETWGGIGDRKVLDEVSELVSTERLPMLLQEEILHLRGQLLMLKRCKEDKLEVDLGA
ncbi:phytochelatin synthase 1, partial [Genlisea aurea]